MDLKELAGDFKLGLFENLPPDVPYYICGEGILARLDKIKNSNTNLDQKSLDLYFESAKDRNKALEKFSGLNRIKIVGDSNGNLKVESEDYILSFHRRKVNSTKTISNEANLTVLSPVLKRRTNGEVRMSFVETFENDVGSRKLRLMTEKFTESFYNELFYLIQNGFEPSSRLVKHLAVNKEVDVYPAKKWAEAFENPR